MLKKNKAVFLRLSEFLFKQKTGLSIVFLSIFFVSYIILNIGRIFRNLVDQGLDDIDGQYVNKLILQLVTSLFFFAFFSFLRSFYINSIASKILSELRLRAYNALLNLPISNFEQLNIGDLVSRFDKDIDNVKRIIVNFLSFILRNMIMFFGGMVLMIKTNSSLSLFVLFSLIIVLIPLLYLSKKVKKMSRAVQESEVFIAKSVEQAALGIKPIHAFNQIQNFYQKFTKKLEKYNSENLNYLFWRSVFFALAMLSVSLIVVGVIWTGSIYIMSGELTSGELISFMYYSIIVAMSISGVAEVVSELTPSTISAERVFGFIDMAQAYRLETKEIKQERVLDSPINTLILADVKFTYEMRGSEILRGVDFKVNTGEFIAIVGPSGIGKSTIFQILLKFYPYKGSILLNDIELKNIDTKSLREQISYVEQEPKIFSGTIRDNIVFSSNPSEEELNKVIHQTGLYEFVSSLPNGIDSEIGERGITLSGGQKQRINLARALIRKAKWLLLDEAMSALDLESERKIMEQIAKNNDFTIISIAHRLSSVQNADKIIVFGDGVVQDIGKHTDLLEHSSLYKKIYMQQNDK